MQDMHSLHSKHTGLDRCSNSFFFKVERDNFFPFRCRLFSEWRLYHSNQLSNEQRSNSHATWETSCISKKAHTFFLPIYVLEKCSTSLHCAHQVNKYSGDDGFHRRKPTFPIGLIILVSPLKWGNLLRTLCVWMLRESLHQKQRSW